jgi:hypothetical protein
MKQASLASSTVQGGGTARLLQIVFDQSVLASLRNPIVDQLATHWTPYHKAASCEPVQHDANVRCLNGSTAFASGLQLLQQVYVLWGKCHFNRRSEAFPHYLLLAHNRATKITKAPWTTSTNTNSKNAVMFVNLPHRRSPPSHAAR